MKSNLCKLALFAATMLVTLSNAAATDGDYEYKIVKGTAGSADVAGSCYNSVYSYYTSFTCQDGDASKCTNEASYCAK